MIIDGRCRPPVPFVLEVLKPPPGSKVFVSRMCTVPMPPSALEKSMDLFWKEMDEAGVDIAVFSWRGDTLGGKPSATVNYTDEVAKVVNARPDRLLGCICVDALGQMHDPLKEIERGVKTYGFKAVGMDVAAGKPKMSFSDERLFPIYEKCIEYDLPIISPVGPLSGASVDTGNPKHMEVALKTFPKLKLILSHGPYPFVDQYITLAMRHPNLYLMPDYQSFLPGVTLYLEAANSILRDQLLFGSAYPIIGVKDAVDFYSRFPFTQEARDHVMYKNWKRLLKLP